MGDGRWQSHDVTIFLHFRHVVYITIRIYWWRINIRFGHEAFTSQPGWRPTQRWLLVSSARDLGTTISIIHSTATIACMPTVNRDC